MKIKGDYLLDTIGGERMAVPLAADGTGRAGLVKLNEVGAFLWEHLQEDTTEKELTEALLAEYEVSGEKAAQDVHKFVTDLRRNGLLED